MNFDSYFSVKFEKKYMGEDVNFNLHVGYILDHFTCVYIFTQHKACMFCGARPFLHIKKVSTVR